jgi:hypothetical protein
MIRVVLLILNLFAAFLIFLIPDKCPKCGEKYWTYTYGKPPKCGR